MIATHGIKIAANFFKHADRDPTERINIEPLARFTEEFLFDAVTSLARLTANIPGEAQLYWSWFQANHEELFRETSPAIDQITQTGKLIKDMPFAQIRELINVHRLRNTPE